MERTEYGTHRLAPLGLILAGLCITLPVLVPYHNFPLLTFYGEWAALFLGLLVAAALLPGKEPPQLPWIALSLIGFCVVLYVQIGLGMVAYPERNITGVMYALWGALLAWAGAALRQQLGLERTSVVLAAFLAGGAWLLAITGFMQYFQIQALFGYFVEPARQVGMYGVLAQRNLFANYVACGLAATGYLYARGSIRLYLAVLLGTPLAMALAFSGARSAWVYVGLLMIVLLWTWAARRDRSDLRGLCFAGVATLVFLLFRLGPAGDAVPRAAEVAPWEWLPYRGDDFTQVPIAPRLLLAWHAVIQFLEHPLLGVGFGEFPWNLYQNTPQLDGHLTPGIDRHAHNIALQLLAETGLSGFLVIAAGIAAWVWRLRLHRSAAEAWIIAVVLIQLAHSLVEFPLWYAQFLGMTLLFMGATGENGLMFGRSFRGRVLTRSMVAMGLVISVLYLKGYRDYEKWYLGTVAAEANAKFAPGEQITELLNLKYSWMFAPYFDLVGAEIISINRDDLETKLALNGHAMRLFPIPSTAARQAMLLALAGRHEEAWECWRRLRIVYPMYETTARIRMQELAKDEPAIARLAARLRSTAGRL